MIYLDHASATPLRPEVREAIAPWAGEAFGHPTARGHPLGWAAESAVEAARALVADFVGCEPREIAFTPSGGDAENLAVLGAAEAQAARGRHVVVSAIASRPVLACAQHLVSRGFEVTVLPVDTEGRVAPEALHAALRDDTTLVSIQAANPEIGTTQDVETLAALCRERGALVHLEASAAAPWQRFDMATDPIDLLTLSGEVLGTPVGIGALAVRRRRPRVRLVPRTFGGGHERGLCAGPVNVLGAVGLGAAAAALLDHGAAEAAAAAARRDRLEDGLLTTVAGARRIGHPTQRVPGIAHLLFQGVEGESLLVGVPDVAMATGSACSSATLEASHVLQALGLDRAAASSTIRLSLGWTTTDEEVDAAAGRIRSAVARIREVSARATPG